MELDSSVELKSSGTDEEATLIDESGISIGVVTGVRILPLLAIEAEVPESLLSIGTELGSCVELEA